MLGGKKGMGYCASFFVAFGQVALAVSGEAQSREDVEQGRFYLGAEMSNCCQVIATG